MLGSTTPAERRLRPARTGRRRSATLDHFEDKIDDVCVQTAKELVNASRCLAASNFDFHIKSLSFINVLKYYARELKTFSANWKGAVKQFTDNAQTFVEDPQVSFARVCARAAFQALFMPLPIFLECCSKTQPLVLLCMC